MPSKPLTLAQIARAQAAYKAWAEVALRARAAGRMDLVETHRPADGATATAIRRLTRELRRALGETAGSKWRNRHVRAYGYTFDSQAALRRYERLRLLQLSGAIDGLQVHPPYVIVDAQVIDGKREPPLRYEADFQYSRDGKTVVEDVKGAWTAEFRIKRRVFLARYAGLYEYAVIDAKGV